MIFKTSQSARRRERSAYRKVLNQSESAARELIKSIRKPEIIARENANTRTNQALFSHEKPCGDPPLKANT